MYSDCSDDDDEDDNEKSNKRSSSSSTGSSSSDESENEKANKRDDREEDDMEEKESDEEREQEDYVLTASELNSIRISRHKMEQWCHAPFFKDCVMGCFVKVGIGTRNNSEDKRIQVYRVAQIVDIFEGPKAYNLGSTKTNKVAKLKHGNDARPFRLEFISNSEFTEAEFLEWKGRMERDKVELIGRDYVERKRKDIQNAVNYNYKDSDIDAIVREKEKYKSNPVNFAIRKTQLFKEKELAEMMNDQEKVEKISQKIEDLEEKAKELDLRRTQNISAISYINEKNRLRNILEAEKAIIEAREKEKEQTDDPFRRRKCAPMLVHKFARNANPVGNSGASNASSNEEALNDTTKETKDVSLVDLALLESGQKPSYTIKSENLSPNSGGGGSVASGNASPKHNDPLNNDLFSAHNFDIQIDFEIGVGMNNSSVTAHPANHSYSNFGYSHQSSSSSKVAPNRRSLNLEEYKKKKGLI